MKLLSVGSNPKTLKSDALGQYVTAILYMSPARSHGLEDYPTLCPKSTSGCEDSCLATSGRGNMNAVKNARISRAQLFLKEPEVFRYLLFEELRAFSLRALKNNVKPCVRLNGTSDIIWEVKLPQVFTEFPDIQFYDYTKIWQRTDIPDNYHLTYSYSEVNTDLKDIPGNVAVVFGGPKIPETYEGIRVIDGTTHDLRFLDDPEVIVGLRALGRAKKDTTGFVVRNYS